MPASDYVVEKTTLATGLQEWRFENGTVAFRSTIYYNDRQSLETWRDLTRTEAKKRHLLRQGKVAEGVKPSERLSLADVMIEAYAHLDDLARRNDGSEGT